MNKAWAEKNGHFAAQNLDVRLEAGGFGPNGYIEPIAQVVNGTVTVQPVFADESAISRVELRANQTNSHFSSSARDWP